MAVFSQRHLGISLQTRPANMVLDPVAVELDRMQDRMAGLPYSVYSVRRYVQHNCLAYRLMF